MIFTVDRSTSRRTDRWIAPSSSEVHHTMTTKIQVASWPSVWFQVRAMCKRTSSPTAKKLMQRCTTRSWRKKSFLGFRRRVLVRYVVCVPTGLSPNPHEEEDCQLSKGSGVRFWDKDLWPSNSPDQNPLDYYFWSQIEAKACAMPHNTVTALKKDIKKAARTLDTTEITHAVYKFRKRVETVILAEGGHIE